MRILLIILLLNTLNLCISLNAFAWNIGAKGKISGAAIHTTYFLTPNNGVVPVTAKIYLGDVDNGLCQFLTSYDIGKEYLKSGDSIDIDNFLVKSLVGTSYTCMRIEYFYKQISTEMMLLEFDGINYYGSSPANNTVSII